jgi:hypothetical protein
MMESWRERSTDSVEWNMVYADWNLLNSEFW